LDAGGTEKDLLALKTWLERETPLAELVRGGHLRIGIQGRKDAPTGHMGLGQEIVLHLVDTAATVSLTSLMDRTLRAVGAWRANRGRVETGEEPEAHVEALEEASTAPADPPNSRER
jgi:cytochrome b